MHASHNDPNHGTLSRFMFVHAEAEGMYYRVALYDADKGRLCLEDTGGGSEDEWLFDGSSWVCDSLYEVEPGDMKETEFSGCSRCGVCGEVFTTDDPSDDYCGCR